MPLDGFCETKGKDSWLWSGVLRVTPNVLIGHCFLEWFTQLIEAECNHRKFQDGVNFTGTGRIPKHSVVQLLLTRWSVVLSLAQPGATVTPQGIHNELPTVAFTKPKVQAGAQFSSWLFLFCSQGTGANVSTPSVPTEHPLSPGPSQSGTASSSSHSELTLSFNNAAAMRGLSLQSRWAHGGVTQSSSEVFKHLDTVHACLIPIQRRAQ